MFSALRSSSSLRAAQTPFRRSVRLPKASARTTRETARSVRLAREGAARRVATARADPLIDDAGANRATGRRRERPNRRGRAGGAPGGGAGRRRCDGDVTRARGGEHAGHRAGGYLSGGARAPSSRLRRRQPSHLDDRRRIERRASRRSVTRVTDRRFEEPGARCCSSSHSNPALRPDGVVREARGVVLAQARAAARQCSRALWLTSIGSAVATASAAKRRFSLVCGGQVPLPTWSDCLNDARECKRDDP